MDYATSADTFVEQVDDANRTATETFGGEALLHVLRQDENWRARTQRTPFHRGAQTFVRERRRHRHIDFGVVFGQHPGDAFAQQNRILGDHDTRGSSTTSRLGLPTGLEIRSRPSTAAIDEDRRVDAAHQIAMTTERRR